MIRELFAVGLGGAAGSIVRYMLSVWLLGGHTLLGFPAGTFTVNAAGSLLIGILLETTNSAAAGWLLIAGFCGGFTTFDLFGRCRTVAACRRLRACDGLHCVERRGLHRLRRTGHVDRSANCTQLKMKN